MPGWMCGPCTACDEWASVAASLWLQLWLAFVSRVARAVKISLSFAYAVVLS